MISFFKVFSIASYCFSHQLLKNVYRLKKREFHLLRLNFAIKSLGTFLKKMSKNKRFHFSMYSPSLVTASRTSFWKRYTVLKKENSIFIFWIFAIKSLDTSLKWIRKNKWFHFSKYSPSLVTASPNIFIFLKDSVLKKGNSIFIFWIFAILFSNEAYYTRNVTQRLKWKIV